ncbi:MAG: hypothetical protein AMXMBFR13_40310 [Phycisphaerae bacterium]
MKRVRAYAAAGLILGFVATSTPAAPPARPAPINAAQFEHVLRLEAQPQHVAILDVRASYESERERNLEFTRASDDFWTLAWNGGFPGTILALLICAAPL